MNIQIPFYLRISYAGLLLLGLNPILAEQSRVSQSPSGNLVLKKSVRRVVIDVVVTDSDGNPVRGLTKDNFLVKEDGNPQQVLSFEKHDFNTTYVPPKVPQLPPNTFLDVPGAPERGPLYILLLDLVNTEIEDQPTARQQLLKFIDEKPVGARFAIFVITDKLRMVQGFTADQRDLFAAMDPSAPRPHVPRIFLMGRNSGRGDSGMMVSVFNNIANFVDGLPGRKNLIWLSGGFPMSLFPSDDDGQSYRAEIKDTLDTMARGQVAVYPVDVRGVVVTNSYAPAGATPGGGVYNDSRSGRGLGIAASSGSTASATNPQGGTAASSGTPAAGVAGYSLLNSSYATQDEIASVTGGHAFHSNNDLKGELAALTDMGANYYTLSYSPSNEAYDGKLRSIHVDLSRRGYNLSYRRSYYAEDPDSPKSHPTFKVLTSETGPVASKPGESLYANMHHGAPMAHEVFFSAHIHPVGPSAMTTVGQMDYFADQPAFLATNPKKKRLASFHVQQYVADFFVPTRQFNHPAAEGGTRTGPLEFTSVAFDADGQILNSIVQLSSENAIVAGELPTQKIGYHVLQHIDVPSTAISIRVAVRDPTTDHIGTLEVSLPLAPEPQMQAVVPGAATQQGLSATGAKPN